VSWVSIATCVWDSSQMSSQASRATRGGRRNSAIWMKPGVRSPGAAGKRVLRMGWDSLTA